MEGKVFVNGRLCYSYQSVLSSIPIYFFLFRMSSECGVKIREVLGDFFEMILLSRKKIIWLWEAVCKSIDQGGLGIWSIEKMNKAFAWKIVVVVGVIHSRFM